jgi:hypothetical protein
LSQPFTPEKMAEIILSSLMKSLDRNIDQGYNNFISNIGNMGPTIDEYGKSVKRLDTIEQPINKKYGGIIYASKGQLVNFQPKGTDTVPAMLTPGEFVVNKKATQKNMGLLKAINGGAKGYNKGGTVYLAAGGPVSLFDEVGSLMGDYYKNAIQQAQQEGRWLITDKKWTKELRSANNGGAILSIGLSKAIENKDRTIDSFVDWVESKINQKGGIPLKDNDMVYLLFSSNKNSTNKTLLKNRLKNNQKKTIFTKPKNTIKKVK